jgi:membrane-bound ClpP family serine protease
VVEVFVPSAGLISLTATGCAIAGLYCLFKFSTGWGITGLATLAILGPALFTFAIKVWPHTPIGRKMLGERPPEEIERERLESQRQRDALLALVGQEGVVLTDLRPVGMVQIGPKRYDALSEVGLIRAGTKVRVVVAEPSQLRVRAIS